MRLANNLNFKQTMKTVQIGLGPIGQQVVKYITERPGIEVAAAVDSDPEKAGKNLNEIGDGNLPELPIHSTLSSALQNAKPDIAVLTTVSKLTRMEALIEEVAKAGLDIVSTCEELTYPWQTQPDCAERIDQCCKSNGISCLSTGVNPGFLMDYLPVVLTSVCQHVEHIAVSRMQDASHRRGPFQNKIGVGMTPDEFHTKKDSISHVGLPESAWMIAKALNWNIDEVRESINPVIAERDVSSEGVNVPKGYVLGVEQIATGTLNGREILKLEFRAAIGEPEPRDMVKIKGKPSFQSIIPGGINGDIATAAITVNAIRSVLKMDAGLKTMLDIPAASYFSGEAKVSQYL